MADMINEPIKGLQEILEEVIKDAEIKDEIRINNNSHDNFFKDDSQSLSIN